MNVAFDTLAFTEALTAAGMPEKQSKAFAKAVQDHAMAQVASKSDIKDAVHALTIRGVVALFAFAGLIVGLIKF